MLAAAALALGLVFGLRWPLLLALTLLATGIFSRTLTGRISSAWLTFSEVIGKFNSRVILTLIFCLVLTPVAYLYRVFKKDPLKLEKLRGRGSYFHDRAHTYAKADLENVW